MRGADRAGCTAQDKFAIASSKPKLSRKRIGAPSSCMFLTAQGTASIPATAAAQDGAIHHCVEEAPAGDETAQAQGSAARPAGGLRMKRKPAEAPIKANPPRVKTPASASAIFSKIQIRMTVAGSTSQLLPNRTSMAMNSGARAATATAAMRAPCGALRTSASRQAKPYRKTNEKDRPGGEEIFGARGTHAKQPIGQRGRKGRQHAQMRRGAARIAERIGEAPGGDQRFRDIIAFEARGSRGPGGNDQPRQRAANQDRDDDGRLAGP